MRKPHKRTPGVLLMSTLRAHGVSLVWYLAQYQAQGGLCAICRRPETRRHHRTGRLCRLSVDHDHTTGAKRGLLCFGCNVFLAQVENPLPAVLGRAMHYLDEHRQIDRSQP